uniref:SFRICE_010857 n=1 Tax=Spodoptera frugiperda TaxID=7108 RepID=A0A2H1VCC4_SPOFR
MKFNADRVQINEAIREEWSPENVFAKIVLLVERNIPNVNVDTILSEGFVHPGFKAFTIATCFSSILKLKEAGRINVIKDPDTLEIINITIADAEQITDYIHSLSI